MYVSEQLAQDAHILNFQSPHLNAQSVPSLHKDLVDFKVEEDQTIILNFSGVKKLDSAALASLVNLIFKNVQARKIEIHSASHAVEKAIKILKLDRYVTMKS